MKHSTGLTGFQKRYVCLLAAALTLLSACAGGEPALVEETPALTTAETIAPPEQAVNSLFGVPYHAGTGAINPITEPIQMNRDVYSLMFDTLFRVDAQFQPQYSLCAAAELDGTALYLAVRDGVQFHDGSALTAADVVYSLKMAMEDEASVYRGRFDGVESIEADGSGRVVLTLAEARPSIPALLDIPIVKRNTGRGTDAVGSGRYRMMETDGQRYLVPNTAHFTGQSAGTQMTHMLLTEVADADALVYGAASGNIDILRADAFADGAVELRADADRYRLDTSELLLIGFRTGGGLFADRSVRLAAAALLDAKTFCSETLNGGAAAAPSLFQPALGYEFPAETASASGTPEALAAAVANIGGYRRGADGVFKNADGTALTLTMLVNGDAAYSGAAAAAVSGAFAEAGLTVEIDAKPAQDYAAALEKGSFDLYFGAFDAGADFDFRPLLRGNGAENHTGSGNSDLNLLLDAYAQAGTADGELIARQIAEKVLGEAAIVPIGYRYTEMLLNRKFGVSNVAPVAGDLFYNVYDWTRRR